MPTFAAQPISRTGHYSETKSLKNYNVKITLKPKFITPLILLKLTLSAGSKVLFLSDFSNSTTMHWKCIGCDRTESPISLFEYHVCITVI